jgi:hypothetical protein
VRDVGVGGMEAEDYHWLSCASVVARSLFIEERVKYHVFCPFIVGIVMEERCYQIASADSEGSASGIVERNTLEDP